MPLIFVPLALLVLVTLMVLMLPWSILQRYRAGTARRLARAWLALLNFVGMGFAAMIFLGTGAISGVWIPHAFAYSALGLAGGCALGLIGLTLARWERTPQSLHYTPNRWLVFSLTLAVAMRLCLGLWRGWQAWHTTPHEESWLTTSGLAGSMAAGALVLGYYLAFWGGVWIHARNQGERL